MQDNKREQVQILREKHRDAALRKYYQHSEVDIEMIFDSAWDKVYSRIEWHRSFNEISKFIKLDLKLKFGSRYADFKDKYENRIIVKKPIATLYDLESVMGAVENDEVELLNHLLSLLQPRERDILVRWLYDEPIEISKTFDINPIVEKLYKLTNGLSI